MRISLEIQTVTFYVLAAGKWEKAHKLLKNNPTLTDLGDELETYGKKLENTGRFKEAEKLYLALDKVDLAINMYKNCQRYDEVRMRFTVYISQLRRGRTTKANLTFRSLDDVSREQVPQ